MTEAKFTRADVLLLRETTRYVAANDVVDKEYCYKREFEDFDELANRIEMVVAAPIVFTRVELEMMKDVGSFLRKQGLLGAVFIEDVANRIQASLNAEGK